MLGRELKDMDINIPVLGHVSVKEAILPFGKFPNEDAILGPEMKSTGEVMGVDKTFGKAFAKSQMSASSSLPTKGTVFISVNKNSKDRIIEPIKTLAGLGFKILATEGTRDNLLSHGVNAELVYKLNEGRPNLVDHLINKTVSLIINNPNTDKSVSDGKYIRQAAIRHNVPLITTVQGLNAAVNGIESLAKGNLEVYSLQELYDYSDN
jgi:carbamoyl-phosphate synthase large subunit